MFIYFSEPQARKNDFRGPDVFVVLDTTTRVHRSWVVWEEEGKTPDVVIELTSSSTEKTDRSDKMRIYSKVFKVAEYYLFDPLTAELEGYRLDPRSRTYRPLQPDKQGRLPWHQLGLMLGVVGWDLRRLTALRNVDAPVKSPFWRGGSSVTLTICEISTG
jgi:Uma2 family endonuclease